MKRGIVHKFGGTILLVQVLCCTLNAQVAVHAGFLQDSIRIGDRVEYYLAARYPSSLTVLFPDSTFQFDPFEFHKKKYFPTTSAQGQSYDSTVYSLVSFDISDVQYLTLPVFVVNPGDCTRYKPIRDSLFLQSMIKTPVPDTVSAQNLPLKENTLYQRVQLLFNYPVLTIVVVVLVVIAIVVWIVFGKRIRRHFALKRLEKSHQRFMQAFASILEQIKSHFSPQHAESALSLWKKYLEQLEQKPYTKLTTRETVRMEKDEELGRSLHNIDRAIYGNFTAVLDPFERLREVAHTRYTRKIEELKNG